MLRQKYSDINQLMDSDITRYEGYPGILFLRRIYPWADRPA